MRSRLLGRFFLLAAIVLFGFSAHADAATLQATPSTFVTVVNGAAGGDTVQLAAGAYGSKQLTVRKASLVTMAPASGATVSISPSLQGAAFLRFDGFKGASSIGGLNIGGTNPSHLEVINSRFTGQAGIDVSNDHDTAILLDSDTFDGIDACASCQEGRVTVSWPGGPGTQNSGVTISNSHFGGGGCSDGVQDGAYGVVIKNNVFDGVTQSCSRHIDSIQLYGQSHTTITGNLIRGFADGSAIMAPDGGNTELITNNVIDKGATGTGSAVQFGHHNGTIFAHNTVRGTDVHSWVGSGDATPNRNVILRDNVMINATFVASGCVSCTLSYNLFSSASNSVGTNAIVATPTFSGGSNPTTFAGWTLASGSAGKANASDGTDRGITSSDAPPPPPADTTPPDTTITTAPTDTTSTDASISFTATESGATFQCRIDSGTFATCSSPKQYTSLAVGSHTVEVRATDVAGNTDQSPASATWAVQSPPPPADCAQTAAERDQALADLAAMTTDRDAWKARAQTAEAALADANATLDQVRGQRDDYQAHLNAALDKIAAALHDLGG